MKHLVFTLLAALVFSGAVNMEDIQLKKFENKIQHPLIFTMRLVGLRKTIIGFFSQVYATCRKRR